MKEIPFYPNRDDNISCMLACLRSGLEYFTEQEWSWEKLEKLTGFQPDKAAWTVKAWTTLVNQGFDIWMIEGFDYKKYAKEGEKYLSSFLKPEELAWQLEHTNIRDIYGLLPEFIKTVRHYRRSPKLDDIDEMLDRGYLVFVQLNSKVLNDEDGYSAHMILVHSKDNAGYIAHDPGEQGKAIPNRNISAEKLWEAMGGDNNTVEVTGMKLKSKDSFRERLDVFALSKHPDLSRAFVARLIDEEKILVNGKPSKPGYRLRSSDIVEINFDRREHETIEEIELPVIYEDADVLVVNKPTGVISHARGRYWNEPSVASFVRQKTGQEGERAGIVHRLDRATSGVMICAKNTETMSFLQKQFSTRNVKKKYMAVIEGHVNPEEAIIDMPIDRNPKAPATFRVNNNGKASQTHYKVVKSNAGFSLLELTPVTGRTHQLRVHLKHLGHPIVGDVLYEGRPAGRLLLHAYSLEIELPSGKHKTFTAELPDEFRDIMEQV